MADGLKKSASRAAFWSLFDRIGGQGVQFVFGIILARELSREDYGIMAMLVIFTAMAQAFINSGFGQALIQKKNATRQDECSVFYFNIFLGALMTGLLCLAAPLIAALFKEPILKPIMRMLSLNLLVGSFGILQATLLMKQLDFKTLAKVSLIASVPSGVLAVTMAYSGFGVWSLVALMLSNQLLRTSLLWLLHDWRPSWTFSFASLRGMFAYGSKLLSSELIFSFFNNLNLFVFGIIFAKANLGLYAKAKEFQRFSIQNLSFVVGRVTFPVFSKMQDDKPRLKRGVRKALTTLSMIGFPMMVGMGVVAEPMVRVILLEKWVPCVPYLQLLCVIGALYPLQTANLNVLKAQGRSDLNLRLSILKNTLKLFLLSFTWRWGIEGVLWGEIALSFFCYYVNTHYTAKLIQYPMLEQIRDFFPYLASAVAMGAVVYAIQFVITDHLVLQLIAQVAAGATLFASSMYLMRAPAFFEALDIIKEALPSRSGAKSL